MNTMKEIWSNVKKKSPLGKDTLKSRLQVKTLYGNEELRKQNKRFNNLHFILKYKIVVPALIILKKWHDKKFKKDNAERISLVQFEYVKLFDEAFDEASANWLCNYLQALSPPDKKKTIEEMRTIVKDSSWGVKWLQMSKELMKTFFMNDDAYLEWLPMFMIELHQRMNVHLKERIDNKGRVHHLLHTVPAVMDKDYEMVYLNIRTMKKFEVSPVGRHGGEQKSTGTKKKKKEGTDSRKGAITAHNG